MPLERQKAIFYTKMKNFVHQADIFLHRNEIMIFLWEKNNYVRGNFIHILGLISFKFNTAFLFFISCIEIDWKQLLRVQDICNKIKPSFRRT